MQRIKKSQKDKIFYVLLCLYLFYYSYRYVLKYNFSGTSPTYSDTPIELQLPKYIVLSILIIVLVVLTGRKIALAEKNKSIAFSLLFLITQFLLLGIYSRNTDAISIAMILFPCLLFLKRRNIFWIDKIDRIICVFWWYSTVYEVIQLLLYFTIGRLPALAYASGKITDVRFGGAWDDPNGYALLLIFYIFYFLFKYKGVKQFFCVCTSGLMLILTWSGTGFIVMMATVIIMALIKANDKKLINKYLFYGIMVFTVVLVVFLVFHEQVADTFGYYLLHKKESVYLHKSGWDISKLGFMTFIGVRPCYLKSEVGYIRMLSVGGFPALMIFFYLVNSVYNRLRKHVILIRKYKPLMYGSLAYTIAFILFEINLPLVTSFSCMGFFSVIICIALTTIPDGKKAVEGYKK